MGESEKHESGREFEREVGVETQVAPEVRAQAGAQEGAKEEGEGGAMAELAQVREELARSRELIEKAKRERDVQRALFDAGAVDVDAVGALVERELAGAETSVATAVERIRSTKPALFKARAHGSGGGGATTRSTLMTGSTGDDAGAATRAARAAAGQGDRNALLLYLRLRRQGAD